MKPRSLLTIPLCSLICLTLQAQRRERPTMGWSSWNTYRVHISDSLICSQADAMVRLGLKKAGYRYVNIDDGYFGGRDAQGHLLTHPQRFPQGLAPVVSHIHQLGLKAGIYSDAGRNTCGNYWDKDTLGQGVGLYGHDSQDAALFFRQWGFDFIKVDFCGGDASQNTEQLQLDEQERYKAIQQAILQTGRKDVRLNVCRWTFPGTWVTNIASSWRIDADISADWPSVKRIIARNRYLSAYATDGHYNDMDMLEIGRGLTETEERTHFGMWCMQASPLLIGCDLNRIPQSSLQLLTNATLIGINQDPLGQQAQVVEADHGVYLYVKDLQRAHHTTRAVAICNLTDENRTFTLRFSDLGLNGRIRLLDAFTQRPLPPCTSRQVTFHMAPHDTRVLVATGETRTEQSLYEAETAWLERYQRMGWNNALGYADYAESAECSGGAKVVWLGHHPDNYLEWRHVHCQKSGNYALQIYYSSPEARSLQCTINGQFTQALSAPPVSQEASGCITLHVRLKKGDNTIRLGNDQAWCPDIDCMKIIRE